MAYQKFYFEKATSSDLAQRRGPYHAAYLAKSAHVSGYLKTLTRDHHTAEDLSQEVWSFVWFNFQEKDFQNLGLLRSKAYQIFIDFTRKEKTRSFVEFRDEIPEEKLIPFKPKELWNSDEEKVQEYTYWENFLPLKFDKKDRQCFWLKNRYDFTIMEIAERVGLPKSTVHDRIKYVAKACAERFKEKF